MKERVHGYREDSYFRNLDEIDRHVKEWRVLLQCPKCGQLWLVDVFDKVESLFAFKIDKPEDSKRSFFEIHKKFLTEFRGGYSSEKCAMMGCKNKALKDLAYCPECAINKHGIYE